MVLDPSQRKQVARARVARLASVRPDGRPHVVPITFALDGDTIVTIIDQKPKTTTSLQRLRNIAGQPAVSVIVDHYDDDWARLWWVRADGTARIETDGDDRDRAIVTLADKYAPYRDDPPEGPAIIVAVDQWTSWSASSPG